MSSLHLDRHSSPVPKKRQKALRDVQEHTERDREHIQWNDWDESKGREEQRNERGENTREGGLLVESILTKRELPMATCDSRSLGYLANAKQPLGGQIAVAGANDDKRVRLW
ncbi:hypothetical protein E4U48_001143 [Claviceps purpurea]|nr:hypothetical protein E4U27_001621 [Claviceps purpurea]KAG6277354.1 hypothetical protein E4U48_001143 [Claviceps purpurea]